MKDSFEKQQRYYELGETYFWLASHHDIVMAFANSLFREQRRTRELKILDVGCGPGNLISRLLPWGEVIGADASADALTFCQQKHNVQVKQIMTKDLPFPDNTFDFVFAIEVIEHIEDDLNAMRELYRILKPNGFLITTVPAFMFLWGSHDEWNGHFRRYTKRQFCRLAVAGGFAVEKSRYFKLLFFLPLVILRFLKKATNKKTDDFYAVSPPINRLFRRLINAETPIISTFNLPIGTSLISILHKD